MTATTATRLSPDVSAGYAACARITRRTAPPTTGARALLPRERRRHVYAVYALCRLADDIVDAAGRDPRRVSETRAALAAFRARFETALADGAPAGGRTPVMAAIATRSRPAGSTRSASTGSSARWRCDLDGGAATRPGTTSGLHGGLRRRHRRDDAAGAAAHLAAGDGAGPRARPRLPAHQLPARRRRGPRPGARLPAAGGPAPLRRRPVAPRRHAVARADGVRDRAQPRALPRRPTRASPGCRRRRPAASRPRGSCTRASSSASRTPTTTCSADARASPPWSRPPPPPGSSSPAGCREPGRGVRAAGARAHPAVPGSRAAPRPDAPDVAAGPRGPDHPRATARPAAGSGRLVRRRHLVRARQDLGDPRHRRRRGGPLPRLGGAAAGGSGRLPAHGGPAGRLRGDPGRRGVPLARARPAATATQGWRSFAAHDDGVLLWVQLPTAGETTRELPVITPRPPLAASVSAVLTRRAVCEPDDVIANRLDPWHGAWFHPYSFSHLTRGRGGVRARPARGRRDVPALEVVGRSGAGGVHARPTGAPS